jgi:hypothetical protein
MKAQSIFYVMTILLFSSCEESFLGKCFSGEATIVRKSVEVEGNITRLFIEGEAEIYLKYDDTQFIEFEFPENLVDDIEFIYDSGNYTIKNHVTCKWRKEHYAPKFIISLPYVSRIDILDNATIACIDTLRYNYLKFYSYGPGDLDLKVNMKNLNVQGDYVADIFVNGKVENLTLLYKLHGRFFGQDLESANINVTHNGENDLHINPLQKLNAKLTNFGNLKVYNNPTELTVSEEGKGRMMLVE